MAKKKPKIHPLLLKFMIVMDVVPGRSDQADLGDPISIITLAYDGEIERPFMIDLHDTEKLAVSLLRVLSHHGDAKADLILSNYYPPKGDRHDG